MAVKFSGFTSSSLNSTGFIVGYDSATNSNIRISKSTLDTTYQATLISTANIKTINGNSILGSGDLVVGGSSSLAVGTTPITSGTIGRVLFQGTGDVLQQNANLFWDNTNGRLGIGTATPLTTLQIAGSATVQNLLPQTSNTYTLGTGGNTFASGYFGGFLVASAAYFNSINAASTNLIFNNVSGTHLATFFSTGNLLIQTGGTTTDAGFKLDVNGSTRIKGTGTTSATTAFRVQDSTGTDTIVVRDDGRLGIRNSAPSYPLDVTGTGRIVTFYTQLVLANDNFLNFRSAGGNSLTQIILETSGSQTPTSGDASLVNALSTFAPTSGTAQYNALQITSTINQTGGANGITRGFYVNPTLTSASNFRAIETARGNVVFGNLPTSSAGLPTGAIWNDGGTLKIV